MYPGECKACTLLYIPKVGWVPTGWLETTHSHYCPNHNYHPLQHRHTCRCNPQSYYASVRGGKRSTRKGGYRY